MKNATLDQVAESLRLRAWIPSLFALVVLFQGTACCGADTNFPALVKKFSADRHKLCDRLARQTNIPCPAGVKEFFEAAEEGDWLSLSNRFNGFMISADKPGDGIRPEFHNALWSPIHETMGVYEVMLAWKKDSTLPAMFYGPILASMPANSIYIGGTDCGRFLVTAVNAVQPTGSVFCITQNALADQSYMAHLRAVYGQDLWLPDDRGMAAAFQQFVEDSRSGKNKAGISIKDGRVQVTGVLAVMEINGILCRMIFDHNKDKHEFFVEESYALEWMYPYLEPCGLIMKLNNEPVRELGDNTIKRDMEFWTGMVASLKANSAFSSCPAARKAFAKLRCATAGIYAHRKRYGEAEACFAQALDLCPYSPEAYSRFAKMQEERDRVKEAVELLEKFLNIDAAIMAEYADGEPKDTIEKVRQQLTDLRNKRPLAEPEVKQLQALVQRLGAKEARDRVAARKDIAAFGSRAIPLLRKYGGDDDPEVRASVKDLIQELAGSSETVPVAAEKDRMAEPVEEYVVEAGDTVAKIAKMHGLTINELLALNQGLDPRKLKIGQRLRVK